MPRVKGLGKKKWKYGIDMPEFSGKSWKELNDVWPINMRTSNEAYFILCGFLPAFERVKPFIRKITGQNRKFAFNFRELALLAWCSRCEEAKEGLCTEAYAFQKGINQGMRTFWIRKASLTKLGLIENIPTYTQSKAYRITEKGRMVLRKFIELVEESHVQLREIWSKDVPGTIYAETKPIDDWIKGCTEGIQTEQESMETDKPKPFTIIE